MSAGNDGGDLACLRIIISREIGELIEPAGSDRHQLGNAGEVPVRVEDLGVAQVSRQRQHLLVNLGIVGVPAHQPPHGEGVAQVVQARGIVSAAIDPTETVAQTIEDAVRLPLSK